MKRSADYQSAEVSYGIELMVENSPWEIRKAIKKAERIVEDALVIKMNQQVKLLNTMARHRGADKDG